MLDVSGETRSVPSIILVVAKAGAKAGKSSSGRWDRVARDNLRMALCNANLPLFWVEHQLGSPRIPWFARNYPPPALFIDSQEILGAAPPHSPCSRIYWDAGRPCGAPSMEQIWQALVNASRKRERRTSTSATPRVQDPSP